MPLEGSVTLFGSGTTFGAYRIVRALGEGGMGTVYEAVHTRLNKRVALKTLHKQFAMNAEATERFVREGKAAARLRHAHAVDVADVAIENGTPYLVMEFLEGEDFSKLIARSAPLPPEQLVEIMLPVCAAIAAAHDEGIVHRDLKPENIFLARPKQGGLHPKVLDFGISKVVDNDGRELTKASSVLGSPFYMSPEHAHGARYVDAKSDEYSLGVILCEQGREREALAEFTRAWEMGHTPRVRAQMALVEQALGDWVTAYEHMTEALDARTDAWITSRRSVLDEAYAVIRQHVGRIDIVSEPYGAEVWVDGVLRGRSPLPRPIVLLVGAHVIEARMQGRVTTPLRVTIAADASRHEQVTLPPIVVEASPSPQPISGPPSSGHESGGGPGAGPWVLVGVGAAAVVAGAVFMVLRGNELEAAAHECNSTATDFQVCGDAEVTRGQYDMGLVHYNTAVTHSWIAGSAFAVGGAAMGAGLIWYVVARARGANPERPSASSRLRFFVAPHGDGAMIGLGGVM